MAKLGGLTITQLVNKKGQTYRKLKPDLDLLSEQDTIHLIQQNPSIMIRPILTDGQRVVMGFKESEYEDFLR